MTLVEKFYARFLGEPNSGCWLWTGSIRRKTGYGRMGHRPSRVAHGISWEIHKGSIPPGMSVLHKCDTPSCVNPNHLFLGTHQDNMDDMVAKGRAAVGERNFQSKLTREDARQIKSLSGITQRTIAKLYGVTQKVVWNVLNGETWKSS